MTIENPNTKTLIFNNALRLFATNGYENISIRTLAEAVGIKAASIYNHYKNKEEILEACYNFFIEHSNSSRLTPQEYRPILKNGTKTEVLKVIVYEFPPDIFDNMVFAMTIVFSRTYNDERAREIYMRNIDSSMQYLLDFFNCGIELGRFDPFHISNVSLIFLSARLFCASYVTMPSAMENHWIQESVIIFDDLMTLVPFRY